MADAEYYDEYDRPTRDVQSVGAVFNVAGAVLSIGLIGGLAWWGYDLTSRDVSGIPVVQALEGPMRIQPEDPGGTQTSHQGLSVNAVQAEGQAEPAADRLVLAPPPISITENDAPVHEASYTQPAPEVIELDPAEQIALEVGQGVALQVEADAAELETAPAENEMAATPDILPTDVPGVSMSPRPVPRPDVPVAAAPAAAEPLVPTVGTSLVQLGAFDRIEDANRAWDIVTARHGVYFADKDRFIEEASSGNRTFYRLRALGFDDLADARRFCAALVAEGTDCIPTEFR